ncbi:MAG TPA: DNA polymerase IV [Acidimicrobiales bacterium]|nr:DNA polymerase IV [Acidimicrobiales bacterium]
MGPSPGATVLHVDLDAFYASVEQLMDPALRGRPIAVGGGVVLAASYEAKAFGVAAGMPAWRARQLCGDIRFVEGHFGEYQRLGDRVIDILRDFTPAVERVSIDEAFIDVAGAVHLFGPPDVIAASIRRRVKDQVGLAVSVGAARTKHLAKIASQVAKPDGLVVVAPGQEMDFLAPLPVRLVWGIGPATQARLAAVGVHTIGQLADTPTGSLQHLLGDAAGHKLGALAANRDPRPVQDGGPAGSVGAQSALGRRYPEPELVRTTLAYLADRVAGRLRSSGRAGRTVTVRVRFASMRAVTRSATLPLPLSSTLTITEVAVDLAHAALAAAGPERQISLLGVSVSHLVDEPTLQLELPLGTADEARRPGSPAGAARWAADRAVDAVRKRFGRGAVGYAAVELGDQPRVPEEFRRLAERER